MTDASEWLLNTRRKVIHDLRRLTESCNTDAIPRRYRLKVRALTEDMLERYSFCKHCNGGGLR